MSTGFGKTIWMVPDGFLPEKSSGEFVSHEAICILNTGDIDANINIAVYFEDREPMDKFSDVCKARRTNHIRLDKITDKEGNKIPVGVPYALRIESNMPVVVQHSRMDTSQSELTLMTTMAY